MARVLLAEDDPVSALVAARALQAAGHEVVVAANGLDALKRLQEEACDALVTDWMMPDLDGLELIRRVRHRFDPVPATLMVTCIDLPQARMHALESGAEEILTKPLRPGDLVEALARCLARRRSGDATSGELTRPIPLPPRAAAAACPVVAIGANAGGPAALRLVLRGLGADAARAAFVVAQHLQPQMLESLVPVLQRETALRVGIAETGTPLRPGRIWLAPGSRHVAVAADGCTLEVIAGPEENHVRPAADLLFRSAAAACGAGCLAVVLTGMGRDAVAGASHVRAAGGRVFVAKPGPHVASAMPEAVVRAGLASAVVPLEDLGPAITRELALPLGARSLPLVG